MRKMLIFGGRKHKHLDSECSLFVHLVFLRWPFLSGFAVQAENAFVFHANKECLHHKVLVWQTSHTRAARLKRTGTHPPPHKTLATFLGDIQLEVLCRFVISK